ncbi:MAG TPA: DUF6262 family protein [Spirochaetales bacterium]|jgi:hypothetical protein|uniref:DUF6262 family protein n=1 Tax=Desulfitibacter alkalitolerans TaxID=264641 RepID=UPI00054E78FA|nr:DUF6262 family protein [Desulfitibacter alkalitolerans]HOT58594.1 DUF6262 family protein [Spirochaetales bacterium]HQK34896.1 DUF6262 family protein [Spirochaetales bacterium]
MNNKVPKELIARQEHQRQTTINTVMRAISELRAEGHRLTIKNLMDYTGLSRSVFGKKHIRAVLVSQGIIASEACEAESTPPESTAKQRMKRKLEENDQQIRRLTEENTALKSECEMLRGKLFLLMQRQSLE